MLDLDRKLFHFINGSLSNPVFDWFMPWVTDLHKSSSSVLVFSAITLLWIYKKRRKALVELIFALCAISFTDSVTYRVLKPCFKRSRPPKVETEIQLRTDRFAGWSFPSNHAGNNFSVASFLSHCYPSLKWFFYFLATTIAFSRVYIGVHYPGDVIVGSLFGFLVGLLCYWFYCRLPPVKKGKVSQPTR